MLKYVIKGNIITYC